MINSAWTPQRVTVLWVVTAGTPWNVDPKLKFTKGMAEGLHLSGYPLQPSAMSAKAYQNRTIVNMFARIISGDATIDEAIKTAEDGLKAVYEA